MRLVGGAPERFRFDVVVVMVHAIPPSKWSVLTLPAVSRYRITIVNLHLQVFKGHVAARNRFYLLQSNAYNTSRVHSNSSAPTQSPPRHPAALLNNSTK